MYRNVGTAIVVLAKRTSVDWTGLHQTFVKYVIPTSFKGCRGRGQFMPTLPTKNAVIPAALNRVKYRFIFSKVSDSLKVR